MDSSSDPSVTKLFRALLENTRAAVIFVDDQRQVRYWSRPCEALLKLLPDEPTELQLAQRLLGDNLLPAPNASEQARPTVSSIELDVNLPSGKSITLHCQVHVIACEGSHWQMVTLDQKTDAFDRLAELKKAANTDPLTELLNRRGFQQVLECQRDLPLTLAFIDVDHFKQINDQLGHVAGDQTLQLLAKQIVTAFPEALGIGRLGGDEFGIILSSETNGSLEITSNRFDQFRVSIMNASAKWPMKTEVSIGVAISYVPNDVPRLALSRADEAMYRSKHEGRNRVTCVEV